MDPALDPLAVSASAPFPTIPAAASPRPRGARPRRHAAPFRSDHPAAAAASASSRRSGSDLSRRPAASFSQQESSPSVGSWATSRDATFVFGSGVAGASEVRSSFSSESGDASLSSLSAGVGELVLDGSGKQNAASVSEGDDLVPKMNTDDSSGASGSNSSLHDFFSQDILHDLTEQMDEGSGVPDQTIRCKGVETSSTAAQTVKSPLCTNVNVCVDSARNRNGNSGDEDAFKKDGSEMPANGDEAQHDLFVFGKHAVRREFAANAATNISKVDSDDKAGATDISEEINVSGAKDSTCTTKFISSNKDPLRLEPHEISAAVKALDPVPSNFAYEDGTAKVSFDNSALQTSESRLDGSGSTSGAKMKQSDQSDFIFSSSTSDQSTLHSQSRHNKKKCGAMGNQASSVQSRPTSSIGLARSEISASQHFMELDAQRTEFRKVEPKIETIGGGVTCAKTENFGHHEDCETWRLRGNQAFGEGKLTEAEQCYTHGIDSCLPNEASKKALMLCYSNRAATRMSMGKMRDALADCREAIHIDSSFLKAQVRAANCLLALGDVEEAQNAFEMCLKSHHLSSFDHKIAEEASDGLQKSQKLSDLIVQSEEYLVTKEFDKIPSALQMISDGLSISLYSNNLMVMKAEALLLLRKYEEVIHFCEETLHLAERNSVCLCPGKPSESKNLVSDSCSVKLWRYYLIAKSYFFLGNLEEAHQFLKKYEQTKSTECRCGKQSQQSISSFSMSISELLRLKAAGNEAFQAGKYSEAVDHYTTALSRSTESLRFSAICFCNRAAAYQAMGQILDAIADCSLAIALDAGYSKAISRRSSLYELIRDYDQASNDLHRLIYLLEKQLQENVAMPSAKTESIHSNLNRANLRLSSLERDARKRFSLNMYFILGIEPSCSAADIKKAYHKAALRHHPDKAGKFLVRSEDISDALWREINSEVRQDADYLFKLIGKAYAMLSDPTKSK